MKTTIQVQNDHYHMRIQYTVSATIKEAWQLLASNQGFSKWFPQLTVEKQGDRRLLVFEEGDFREEMVILTYEEEQEIAYQWDSAKISFGLQEFPGGSRIDFCEEIPQDFGNEFADARKDMTGWLVQNECLAALLNHQSLPDMDQAKEKWQDFVTKELADNN